MKGRQPQTHHQALYQFAAEHAGVSMHVRIGRCRYARVDASYAAADDGQASYYHLRTFSADIVHEYLFRARDGRIVREEIRHRQND